jgi:hypothetical protein
MSTTTWYRSSVQAIAEGEGEASAAFFVRLVSRSIARLWRVDGRLVLFRQRLRTTIVEFGAKVVNFSMKAADFGTICRLICKICPNSRFLTCLQALKFGRHPCNYILQLNHLCAQLVLDAVL